MINFGPYCQPQPINFLSIHSDKIKGNTWWICRFYIFIVMCHELVISTILMSLNWFIFQHFDFVPQLIIACLLMISYVALWFHMLVSHCMVMSWHGKLSILPTLCQGNPPLSLLDSHRKGPVMQSFDVSLLLAWMNWGKQLSGHLFDITEMTM